MPGPVGPTVMSAAAQSKPVCWQVPVTATGRALVKTWATATAYAQYEAVVSAGGMYVCITAGTSASTGAGPSGTSSDITDNTAHWAYVAPNGTTFFGSMIIRNKQASAQPFYYSTSATLAPGGAEVPPGVGEALFYADPTAIFVATTTSTATATVAAYPVANT